LGPVSDVYAVLKKEETKRGRPKKHGLENSKSIGLKKERGQGLSALDVAKISGRGKANANNVSMPQREKNCTTRCTELGQKSRGPP